MERQNQKNLDWTDQFSDLPEGWDIDPALFERIIQERVFHCEGANCSIRGKILAKGEGMLKFVKITATKAVMEKDGITPMRDPKSESGDPLFERLDVERKVRCDHHARLKELVVGEVMENLPEKLRKRGDKLVVKTSTLFQNLSWVREMTQKAKRPERVAAFFLSLTKGAGLEIGVALDCIQPFVPATYKDDKKPHDFLIRGGALLGLVRRDDVAIYYGALHQHKGAFISANLFLYDKSMLAYVEERLVEWKQGADKQAATKAAREAAAAERLATAQTLKQEELEGVKQGAADLLAFLVGAATPATESSGDDDGRKGKKSPKQRKSAPPSAARQIDEQLDAGERATLSDGTPDVLVDEHAGESRPTLAVSLGESPEIAVQLAAVRAQLK